MAKDASVAFTPGPLTTSHSVKEAMLHDAGSWHFEFNAIVKSIRERLLKLGGVSKEGGFETVLLQGSGTFGVEAVFQTCVPDEQFFQASFIHNPVCLVCGWSCSTDRDGPTKWA